MVSQSIGITDSKYLNIQGGTLIMRLLILSTFFFILITNVVYGLDQEKIDQLTQVMNTGCGLGESYRIQIGGDGKVLLFKKRLEGQFEASRDKTNSIINFIASDNGRIEIAEDTRNCMKPYMDRIFDAILSYKQSRNVNKKICLSAFGMNWQTSEDAKNHLIIMAKREAASEIFGEMIQSLTQVRDFTLRQVDIESVSVGVIRVKGAPEYRQGTGFGELCAEIHAYVFAEDIQRFEPRKVKKKACIADPRLSLGEVRTTAEQQARIQAVRDFEPKLHTLDDDVVINLIHASRTEASGFVPETTTYCVTASGTVYPIELMSVINRTKTNKQKTLWENLLIERLKLRTAEASAEYSSGYSAMHAIDSSNSSYWCTPSGTKKGYLVISIDSEDPVLITRIDFQWQYKGAKDYTIQVSNDNSKYETIHTSLNKAPRKNESVEISPIEGKYIKIDVTHANNPSYIALYDVAVFGKLKVRSGS